MACFSLTLTAVLLASVCYCSVHCTSSTFELSPLEDFSRDTTTAIGKATLSLQWNDNTTTTSLSNTHFNIFTEENDSTTTTSLSSTHLNIFTEENDSTMTTSLSSSHFNILTTEEKDNRTQTSLSNMHFSSTTDATDTTTAKPDPTTSATVEQELDVEVYNLTISLKGETWFLLEFGLAGDNISESSYLLTAETSNKPIKCLLRFPDLNGQTNETFTYNFSKESNCSNVELLPCADYEISFLSLNTSKGEQKSRVRTSGRPIVRDRNLSAKWLSNTSNNAQVRLSWNGLDDCNQHLTDWKLHFEYLDGLGDFDVYASNCSSSGNRDYVIELSQHNKYTQSDCKHSALPKELDMCRELKITILADFKNDFTPHQREQTFVLRPKEMPLVTANAVPINTDCILVNWTLSEDFSGSCINDSKIEISSGRKDSVPLYEKVNLTDFSKMICTLESGTKYNVTVRAFWKNNMNTSSNALTIEIDPEPNAIATYAIIGVILLIIAVGIIGIYLYKLRRDQAFNRERSTSLFSKLGRRQSHLVKVRDLPKIASNLMASAGHLLEMEFEDLNIIAEAQKGDVYKSALSSGNKIKNRYLNILPYEHSRVLLNEKPDDPESTYINASFIMGYNRPKEYIASQGPKSNTIKDFWRMVWEQNVRIIVMVTALAERGKPKCDQYWPDVSQKSTFDELSVETELEEPELIYIKRTLNVRCSDATRSVYQFCFRDWPDFGCPASPEVLIRFIEVIRSTFLWLQTENSPILVHCSAGVGRTGTFIVVDWLMQQASAGEDIDIFSTVMQTRSCRMKMVQSEEQYEYVYKCLSHYVTTRLLQLQAGLQQDNERALLLRIRDSIPLIDFSNETRCRIEA